MGRGRSLGELRRNAGLSQEQLAQLLDVSVRTIQRWEQGSALPLPRHLAMLAGAVSVGTAEVSRVLGVPGDVGCVDEPAATPADVDALIAAAARRAGDFDSVLATTAVDNSRLDWLGVTIAELATAYVHTPAVDLVVRIAEVRDETITLIRRGVRPRQLRDAYLIAGVGCLLLASASHDGRG